MAEWGESMARRPKVAQAREFKIHETSRDKDVARRCLPRRELPRRWTCRFSFARLPANAANVALTKWRGRRFLAMKGRKAPFVNGERFFPIWAFVRKIRWIFPTALCSRTKTYLCLIEFSISWIQTSNTFNYFNHWCTEHVSLQFPFLNVWFLWKHFFNKTFEFIFRDFFFKYQLKFIRKFNFERERMKRLQEQYFGNKNLKICLKTKKWVKM